MLLDPTRRKHSMRLKSLTILEDFDSRLGVTIDMLRRRSPLAVLDELSHRVEYIVTGYQDRSWSLLYVLMCYQICVHG